MSFGLKLRKFPKEEIRKRVDHAARILDITELLDRKPKALSGGQRQRVAMGRAIVRNPKVFLFDEPLSNLDAKLRVQMRTEIKRVHQLVKTTTVYVTHDQVEAMTLADRVVVMNNGRIEQIATPQELYHHPKTLFVAGFMGSPAMNFMRCRLEQNGTGLRVRLSDAVSLPVPASQSARYQTLTGKELVFGLRPEHITEPRRNDRDQQCEFSATLDVVGSLRQGRSRQRHRPGRSDAALRRHGPHAPDRSAKRRGALNFFQSGKRNRRGVAAPALTFRVYGRLKRRIRPKCPCRCSRASWPPKSG
jgi:multiple sugar transport system ATP-binding protein